MRTKQGVGAITALLAASAFASGCGEGSAENVFLYIINGYPGTQSLDIIGPGGQVASGVEFGDRMASDGPCEADEQCVPLKVDRSRGTDFSYRLESMTEPVEIDVDLFAMYPQETGTLILTRRSGTPEIQLRLLRHVQTISSDCSISFTNGLALNNEFLPEGYNNFSIVPEFKFDDIASIGYLDESEQPFLTECGALPTGEDEHDQLARTDLQDVIGANPWFLPTECPDIENSICFTWGVPVADNRSRLVGDGQTASIRTTFEYYQCVQGAISIKQPQDEMTPLPFPDADAQVQCPDDPITWDDVQVDFAQVQACNQAVTRQVQMVHPGEDVEQLVYFSTTDLFCDIEFRIRNIGQDIVFGPRSGNDLGSHQNGELVTSKIQIPAGSQHFWVMLGRPVNPIIWQWDSGDTFVDLATFPYPNDKNELIGDYDSR